MMILTWCWWRYRGEFPPLFSGYYNCTELIPMIPYISISLNNVFVEIQTLEHDFRKTKIFSFHFVDI